MSLYHLSAVLRHAVTATRPRRCDAADSVVCDFIMRIFSGHTLPGLNDETEKLRAEMLADRREVAVTDFGTGRGKKDPLRRITDIATMASLPRRQSQYLSLLASAVCGDNGGSDDIVLELGTCLGLSALTLSKAVTGRVVTVEGCPALAMIARENLRRHNAANTTVINSEFTGALAQMKETGTRVRLAFIDGNHTGEALREYYQAIMSMAADDIAVVADDIHISRSMYRAWKEIAEGNRDGLSVETIRFGIIIKNRQRMRGCLRIRC